MKFSYAWLNQLFANKLNLNELADDLTMAGLEIESIHNPGESLQNIVVGEIVSIEKHPDADRLNVCQVDVGSEKLQIVCGAPNARAGIKVPCALIGTKFPEFTIKKSKLRGVESFGMCCSAKEIGLSEEADGLMELSLDLTNGEPITKALKLDDSVIEVSLTPNRADCLSILGIAREVRSIKGLAFDMPKINQITSSDKCKITPTLINTEACPVYSYASISQINNSAQLPDEIIHRLDSADIKSINPVVDLVNYVMLETGQPMHAFDLNKIKGNVVVRNASKQEKMTLLNDQTIEVMENDLVIADENGPLALAGVMGGLESAVETNTTNIFIESAFFTPLSMAGKARSYGLNTDSSHRFERGVDFSQTEHALTRVINLINEHCGGQTSQVTSVSHDLPQRNPIQLRPSKVTRILGRDVSQDEVVQILNNLDLPFTLDDGVFTVTPPAYRFDLEIEEDLVEEVIRVAGYDNIGAMNPKMMLNPRSSNDRYSDVRKIRHTMSDLGYSELVSYSFIDEAMESTVHGNDNLIKLENPIAENMNTMRSRLWSSHIDALKFNTNRGRTQIKFFEIANKFTQDNSNFSEEQVLSGLVSGEAIPKNWIEKNRAHDFYDVKSDLEQLLGDGITMKQSADTISAFHPGQSADIFRDNKKIGCLGKLHPSLQKQLDVDQEVYLFEIGLNQLSENDFKLNTEILKSGPLQRDIAVLVDEDVIAGDVVDVVIKRSINFIKDFRIFDVYQGQGIAEGKKSLAFLILMQDTYKTLEEKDVEKSVTEVINLLKKEFNAELRL